MGKILPLTALQAVNNRDWNAGYHAGYNDEGLLQSSEAYNTGYLVGLQDRLEDIEAVESGDFDNLSESERMVIYGDEKDQI